MPFKRKMRKYWSEVVNNKCQWVIYSEEKGFTTCDREADHCHHIIPESRLLAEGEDPEHTVGMMVCSSHHVRNFGREIYDRDSSFHPEMAHAYKSYRGWKEQAQHMASIMGRRTIDYSDSPFADVSKTYKNKSRNGERICTGDESTDRFYTERMEELATRARLERNVVPPKSTPHKDYNPKKKKKWFSGLF